MASIMRMYLRWRTDILKMAFYECVNRRRNYSDVPISNLGLDINYSVVFSYFSSVDQANAATVHRCGHDDFHPGPFHITSHQPDRSGLWQYRELPELPGLCQKYSLILGTLDVTGHFWRRFQIPGKTVIYCYNQQFWKTTDNSCHTSALVYTDTGP